MWGKDKDSDGDGSKDCVDGCPCDPAKTDPGAAAAESQMWTQKAMDKECH